MRRRVLIRVGAVCLLFVGLGLVGALWPYEPGMDTGTVHGFSWRHPLGPDPAGRDLLLRLVIATRAFVLPGLFGAALAVSLGVVLGALSGYVPPEIRRTPGADFGRAVLAFLLAVPGALPRFMSILFLLVAASGGVWAVLDRLPWLESYALEAYLIGAATGLLYAAEIGHEIQNRVRQCCNEEFIESARADGLSLWRIVGHHILYLQCRGLIYRYAFEVAAAVLVVETSLSYLKGFGVQEPQPSWGNILIMTKDRWRHGDWVMALVPTVVIVGAFILLVRAGDLLSRLPRKGTEGHAGSSIWL